MGLRNSWHAKWIWTEGEPSPRNCYLCVRKAFSAPSQLKSATLRISADSRYVLWLNGKRLGQGPIRSWPFEQSYDVYDIGGYLTRGRNVVAALVQHFGVSTFQYIEGRGALVCQIDLATRGGRTVSVGTDRSWRVRPSEAFSRRVPRMSCQTAWAESYDAGKEFVGWTETDFDDGAWSRAREIGPVGMKPWTRLVKRAIPFLTEEPVPPVGIIRRRVVVPPRYGLSVDLRPNLLPGYTDANQKGFTAMLSTLIHAPRKTSAKLTYVLGPLASLLGAIRLNGREVELKEKVGELNLNAGDNLLMIDVSGFYHEWTTTITLDSDVDLSFKAPFDSRARWATIGPFNSKNEKEFVEAWAARSVDDLRTCTKLIRSVATDHECLEHTFALTVTQREIPGRQIRLDNPGGLLSYNEDATTVFPSRDGDVELLLDFGRELVGFLEFEVEGQSGVVLDWNCFEYMKDGDVQFTYGLNNTLRYVTSEGNQRFHSIVRRGFRYATLTIRNLTEPIKIRRVACLLNTFPVVERGDFLCSDPLLNQVWRMCRYTTRLCMDDTFVDCPAYEQTLWVGDARGEALIEYVTFGEYEMPKRCWRLTGRSLRRSPLTESQVPSGWKNVLTAWSFLWMLACEESYKWSGDKAFLKEIYPALAQNCKGIESFINPKGLLEIEAWNMLDWAPMDTPPSGVVTHQNALAVEALRSTARVARILDKERDAVHYLKGADRIRKAINEHLWSEKDQAFIDSIHADGERSKTISQQTNIMVFLCDCATPERERVIREYVARVQEGWVRVGSPFAMFFMFAALAKIGEFKEILRQTREKWGWMIDMGSTTCWETFPGPNAKWFTRSYCHAWSAGPAYFLSTYQLGVIPAGPGLRKVTVAPEPADLRWARGKVPTPYGEIEVSWTKKDQGFELSVALPKEVEGDAVLPVPCRTIRTEGRGVLGQRIRDSKWVVHLGKGASAKIVASE